ncbi:MAG: hypothetical protein LBC59_05140 [Chitinispirillales bacterium]|jgi:uncharacterized protein (TIGR02145 family)|nr:hypothetical protein [Chitinispirillales bacterium]
MRGFNRQVQGWGVTLLLAAVAVVTAGIFCGTAFAQEKPKAAVYIMGNPEGRDALRMAVNTFLVKSGKYQMVAVDAIDVVAKEQKRQMSGSVSDAQIAKLGQDAGAQYVCVVERTELDGYSYVATRMVSVQSKVAEFADMVELPRGGKIIDIIQWQIGSMLGMDVGPRPTFAQQQAATSQPVAATPQPVAATTKPAAATPQTTAAAPQQAAQQTRVDANSTLTDSRDGKQYRTVVIGGMRWMAENLNYKTSSGSWCYENHNPSCNKYGRLYDWKTAMTVCPSGWYLPSRQEWNDLAASIGENMAGKKLKAKSGWNNNGNGTDEYGFSALPGGGRDSYGRFGGAGSNGDWWTATEDWSGNAYIRNIYYGYGHVVDKNYDKRNGLSVRCVRE